MKKIILFILIAVITSSFTYCILDIKSKPDDKEESVKLVKNSEEMRAVFVSYIDYASLKGKDENKISDIKNNSKNFFHMFFYEY